ncbi:MAG: hypothetical protein L6Q97_08515 [Thermoanaerobaculia bacterium]|nr:hypothetical protein [Thermoanaerobaculia bacterium]
MGVLDVLEKLSTDGIRVEVAFEERTIFRLLMYGCLAAVVAGVATALIRKKITG